MYGDVAWHSHKYLSLLFRQSTCWNEYRIKAHCLILNSALSCSSSQHVCTWSRVVRLLIKDTLFHIDFMTTRGPYPCWVLLQKRPNFSLAGVWLETKTLISSYHCLALSHGCRLLTMCVVPPVPFDFSRHLLTKHASHLAPQSEKCSSH